MHNHTTEIWGRTEARKTMLVLMPIGNDGVSHSVPVEGTKIEARFLASLVANCTAEQVAKALDYAISDRG